MGKFIFKRAKENEGKAYVLTSDADGLSTTELGVVGVNLELDNYSKDIHKEITTVIQDLKSSIPQGRLVILEGPPGGGKTFCVRSLISQVPEAFFVVVPPAMIKNLGDPSIIPILLELKADYGRLDKKEQGKHRPVVLIVEDADECLTARGADNMSSISSILNFTSGILGDLLDIRIIATTNARETEWDEALLRSGRLSDVIHINELSRQEATSVYKRIMEDDTLDYDGSTLLADIYKLAREVKKDLDGPPDGESATKTVSPIENRLNKLKKTRKIGF
jgi:SpoVK/Ycf46/Vps4 family AAA+-type ATPase